MCPWLSMPIAIPPSVAGCAPTVAQVVADAADADSVEFAVSPDPAEPRKSKPHSPPQPCCRYRPVYPLTGRVSRNCSCGAMYPATWQTPEAWVAERMTVGASGTLLKSSPASCPQATTGATAAAVAARGAARAAGAVRSVTAPVIPATAAPDAPGTAAPTTPRVASATAAASGTILRSRPVPVPHIPTTSPFPRPPQGW